MNNSSAWLAGLALCATVRSACHPVGDGKTAIFGSAAGRPLLSSVRVIWQCGVGLLLALALAAASFQVQASGIDPYEEFAKHLRAAQEMAPLSSEVFGDAVSLYNGATTFSAVDIDIPGNSGLPVQLRRSFGIEDRRAINGRLGGFGEWDVDLPYLGGTFEASQGWKVNTANGYDRCTTPAQPLVTAEGASAARIWDGYKMHLPGGGQQDLLVNTAAQVPAVTDGKTYPWITEDWTRLTCQAATANGYPGEGFVALTAAGLKYYFGWVVIRGAERIYTHSIDAGFGGAPIKLYADREEVLMLATRVEDRFGNWVNYSYNGDQLTRIDANDGRSIILSYSDGVITQAVSSVGTWSYAYVANATYSGGYSLNVVTRPDGSKWTYAGTGSLRSTRTMPDDYVPPTVHCNADEPEENTGAFAYSITAPSGALGSFQFQYLRHRRDFVPLSCNDRLQNHLFPEVNAFIDNFTLTSKQVGGPGLSAGTWTYDIGDPAGLVMIGYYDTGQPGPYGTYLTNGSYIPPGTCSNCAESKLVTVTGPDSITKYTFGAQYARNEGRLLSTETDTLAGVALKTVITSYVAEAEIPALPFPANAGTQLGVTYKNPMVARVRPTRSNAIVQDGVSFSSTSNTFNEFARPLSVTRFSSLGYTRTDVTEYENNLGKWVIQLPHKSTNNDTGKVVSQTDYDAATALPLRVYAFGVLKNSSTYNTDGTLASVADGAGHATALSSWSRGIPRSVVYADTSSESAAVNDAGWITALTDENGYATSYGYDAMGRVSQINYPSGDTVAWSAPTVGLVAVAAAEYGLPAGHWTHTAQTGNGRSTTYYDALWRPVLVVSEDTANAASKSFVVTRYDALGRATFSSYPVASLISVNDVLQGTSTVYDALGRVIQARQDSELAAQPVLTSTAEYLPGFQTRMTNPRGYQTTTSYQVFDSPSTDAPVHIDSPGSVTTTITRDIFGKPLTVTRTGPGS